MQTAQLPGFSPCPQRLTDAQIEQYRVSGWLAFTDVLNSEEVAAARGAISELVRRQFSRADASDLVKHQWIDGEDYFVQVEPGTQPDLSNLDAAELAVRKIARFVKSHPVMEALALQHARIQGVLEGLLGPGAILQQDMALVKPPFIGTEKPWHQDQAYFNVLPLDAVVGVWIALDDATIGNGCMHVISGGHRLGPLLHHHLRDCEIAPGRIESERPTPVELPAGGALFFHGLMPHQTPPNTSPDRRRALQFHYRSRESRLVDRDEFDRVFAEKDGTPATCRASSARRRKNAEQAS